MSSGLARIEPAFYTNHHFTNTANALQNWVAPLTEPAHLKSTYRKDLVKDASQYLVSIERLSISTQAIPLIDNRNQDFYMYKGTARVFLPDVIYSVGQLIDWLNSDHGVDLVETLYFNVHRWGLDGDGRVYMDAIGSQMAVIWNQQAWGAPAGATPELFDRQISEDFMEHPATILPLILSPMLAKFLDMPRELVPQWSDPARAQYFYNQVQFTYRALYGAPPTMAGQLYSYGSFLIRLPQNEFSEWSMYRVRGQSSIFDKSTTKNILVTTTLPCVGEMFENEQSRFVLGEFTPPSVTHTTSLYADTSNYINVNYFQSFVHRVVSGMHFITNADLDRELPNVVQTPTTLTLASVVPQQLSYNAGASRRWVDITSPVPLRKINIAIQYQNVQEDDSKTHMVPIPASKSASVKLAWYRKT